MNQTRRSFLGQAALAATAMTFVPAIVKASVPSPPKKKMVPVHDGVILFQGDSITDAGREKNKELPNSAASFGGGYAFLAAASLLDHFAGYNLRIYNRGISGNKVYQLAERWQKDCLDLKPDLVSILIEIHDYCICEMVIMRAPWRNMKRITGSCSPVRVRNCRLSDWLFVNLLLYPGPQQ